MITKCNLRFYLEVKFQVRPYNLNNSGGKKMTISYVRVFVGVYLVIFRTYLNFVFGDSVRSVHIGPADHKHVSV